MKRLLCLVSLLVVSTLVWAATLNLNAATESQLAGLAPIGAVKAKAIVDYRTVNGCFKSIADLLKVKGITQADVDAVNSLVEVGSCPRGLPAPSKAQT